MILNLIPRRIFCALCALNRQHVEGAKPTCLWCDCPLGRREWKARLGRLDPRRTIARWTR